MHMSPPMVRRVILLLGPTQVGKSSVANFLIDSIVDVDKSKLKIGDGTKSCTQRPQCESFTYSYEEKGEKSAEFSVIDTAGAGDSGENDTDNMVALYKCLLEENIEISCVALVVKYPTLEDHQYKSIIDFYKKMLSTAFGKKVIVVLTHAEVKNVAWVNKQKRSGNDPDKVIKRIIENIRASLELEEFKFYAFDALSSPEVVPEDYLHALDCRRKILDECINSMGFRPDQLSFPKSIRWRINDQLEASKLEIRGKAVLQLVEALRIDLSALDTEIPACRSHILKLKEVIRVAKHRIVELDTDQLVMISSNSFNLNFHVFGATASFVCEGLHKIEKVEATEGELFIEDQTDKAVKGRIEGKYLSRLNTTLRISGRSKVVNEQQIKQLKLEVTNKNQEIASEKARLQRIVTEAGRKDNEKTRLEQEYQDSREEITTLLADALTLDQVRSRVSLIAC